MKQQVTINTSSPSVRILVDGDLSVTGWDQQSILADGDLDNLDLSPTGDSVYIRSSGDCNVQLPKDAVIRVERADGDASIKNVSGTVTIDRVGGDLDVETLGVLSVGNVGGDCLAREISGSCRIDRVGGDLAVINLNGPVQASIAGGDVLMNNVESGIDVSAGGDVSLQMQKLVPETYTVRSGGDIKCRVPEDAGLEAELKSGGRRIRIALPGTSGDFRTHQYHFVVGDSAAKLFFRAGGEISLTSLGQKETNFSQSFGQGYGEELSRLGERISREVNESLRNSGLMEDWGEKMSRHAQDVAERAWKKADERVQAAYQRMGKQQEAPTQSPQTPVEPAAPQPETAAEPPSPETGVSEDERMVILQMLQEKKITVDEAEQLLEILDAQDNA